MMAEVDKRVWGHNHYYIVYPVNIIIYQTFLPISLI